MAEGLLSVLGRGRFTVFSAGSMPNGRVNPFALEKLKAIGYDVSQARSKSWDEFATADAPHMDIIITVCDNAAGEVCPVWPGHPATAHWGFPDPAAVEGSDDDKRRAFEKSFHAIRRRIELLVNLPADKREHLTLPGELTRIAAETAAQ
jgi:protein-tyrosine-phosphatase